MSSIERRGTMSSIHVAVEFSSDNSLHSERQRVYTDAHALGLLSQPDTLDLDKLDLIEELENSSILKPTLLRYLDKAAQLRNELRSRIDRGGICVSFMETIEFVEGLEELEVVIGDLLNVTAALAKEEIALDGQLASVKWWSKVRIPGYAVAYVAPLVILVLLDFTEVRICSTVAAILKGLERPMDWYWDNSEKELEGTRDVVKTMRRLAFNPKDKLEDLQSMAQKLRKDFATMRTRPLHEIEIRMLKEQTRKVEKGINQCAEGVERAAVDLLKCIAKG